MTPIVSAFLVGVIVGFAFAAAWDIYFMRKVKGGGKR